MRRREDGAAAAAERLTKMMRSQERSRPWRPGDDLSGRGPGSWFEAINDRLASCVEESADVRAAVRSRSRETFAKAMGEVTGDEMRAALTDAGAAPADAAAIARLAEDVAAAAAGEALRHEVEQRLSEALKLLPQVAGDELRRGEIIRSLLAIPMGPARLAAVEQLGFVRAPGAFVADLDRLEAQGALRREMVADPQMFLEKVLSRAPDLAVAAQVRAELARAASAAGSRWDLPLELSSGATPPPAASTSTQIGPARGGLADLLDGGERVDAAIERLGRSSPTLALVVAEILDPRPLQTLHDALRTGAAELMSGVPAALNAVTWSHRADSPLVLLRDCVPAARHLFGGADRQEDSVLADGIERHIADREDDYRAWAAVEAIAKGAVRAAFALAPGGIAFSLGTAAFGAATEGFQASWATDVLRGLVGAGVTERWRLDAARTTSQALAGATAEAALDTLFGRTGRPGLGLLIDPPDGPRNPLAPARSHR
ncbi:MAG: hypothetical protein QME96_05685 [Myxococcota bacterium]|nr:hypothetical protein [Myxococcota bacterium]